MSDFDFEWEERVFVGASKLADENERRAYLDEQCDGDSRLLKRMQALLSASVDDHPFLDTALLPTGGLTRPIAPQQPPECVGGNYRIGRQIGAGGFGIVYEAEQLRPVRRNVAVKILRPGMDSQPIIARFQAERQALALMEHPHIARVLDGGITENGYPFFVMELVNGIPITEFCRKQRLPIQDTVQLFIGACQAVQHAHQKGVIHRDLKPSNVLVTECDGPVPKVIDFGVAKALAGRLGDNTIQTGNTQIIGTPMYMSPEQTEFGNPDVDTRADIYSLGALLYELLTGTTLFDRDCFRRAGFDELRKIICEEEPPRPSNRVLAVDELSLSTSGTKPFGRTWSRNLQGDLDWIVMKCLEKDRNRRYQSVGALVADLQRYVSGEAVEARPTSRFYRLRKFANRNRLAVLFSAAILILVVAGIAGTSAGLLRAQRHQLSAERARIQAQLERDNAVNAAQQAASNMVLSQQHLDLAIRVVDEFCTRVSDDLRLNQQDMRPLRQALLQQAVDFHTTLLERRSWTDAAHSDLAGSYHRLAKLTAEIDKPDKAIELYTQALSHFDAALANQADTASLDLQRLTLLGEMALLHSDLGNSNQAKAMLNSGIESLRMLAQRNPEQESVRAELAQQLSLLAYTLNLLGELKQSESVWRDAIEQWRILSQHKPEQLELASHLAHAHWKLAENLRLQQVSNWRQSEAELMEALRIQKRVVSNPSVSDHQQLILAAILRSLGLIKRITGDGELALDFVGAAKEVQTRLVQQQPSVVPYAVELAYTQIELGRCQRMLNNASAARESLQSAVDLLERALDVSQNNTQYASHLADALAQMANLAKAANNHRAAIECLDRSIALLEGILTREPDYTNAHEFLPPALMDRGMLRCESGQFMDAIADCDRAIGLANPSTRAYMRLQRAWVLVRSGDHERAVSESQAAVAELAKSCPPHVMVDGFVLAARVTGEATLLIDPDMHPGADFNAQTFEDYVQITIDLLLRARQLQGAVSDEWKSAPEFQCLRNRPEFARLFED